MRKISKNELVSIVFVFFCLLGGIMLLFAVQDNEAMEKRVEGTSVLVAVQNGEDIARLQQATINHDGRIAELEARCRALESQPAEISEK